VERIERGGAEGRDCADFRVCIAYTNAANWKGGKKKNSRWSNKPQATTPLQG
jgi:hypothetical protein